MNLSKICLLEAIKDDLVSVSITVLRGEMLFYVINAFMFEVLPPGPDDHVHDVLHADAEVLLRAMPVEDVPSHVFVG